MRQEITFPNDLDEYKKFVLRSLFMDNSQIATLNATGSFETDTPATRAFLGATGLAGEAAGEVLELHKKWLFHGKDLDRTKLVHEMGDVLWYYFLLLASHDLTLDDIISANIAKLEARYGKR